MKTSWLITLAIVGATTSFALHAFSADSKTESVFIDEGDGDFDSMPIPAAGANKAANAKTAAKTAPASQDATPSVQAQRPAPKAVQKTRAEKIAAALKETPAEKPAPAVDKVAASPETVAPDAESTESAAPAPEKTSKKADKRAAKQTAKHSAKAAKAEKVAKSTKAPKARVPASAKKDPGVFVLTRAACPMTREPASESPQMITVKPSKKIWVEKVDGGKWFRAYNKAGEPGYINGDCVTVQ